MLGNASREGGVLKEELLVPLSPFSPLFSSLLSHRRRQLMMPFSTGTGLDRVGIAGPAHCPWTLHSPAKTRNEKDRRGLARCLFDALVSSFLWKENIKCLESEFSVYLSPMGWLGIYSRCFSQFEGDKDSLLLDGGFYFLIPVRLIRDN